MPQQNGEKKRGGGCRFLLANGLDFTVRPKERYVKSRKRKVMCGEPATIYFSMTRIGNSQKHEAIARSIASMSFRIHGVQDFHIYATADGASDIPKGGHRWRGFGLITG